MTSIRRVRILCILCLGILFLTQTFANASGQDEITNAKQMIADRKYSEARQTLSALTSNPDPNSDISAEAQYLIGRSYKDEGDLQNAIQALDKVIKDYPDNGAWCSTSMLLKGEYQLLNKQYADATKTFKEVLSTYSSKKGICLSARMDLVQTLMIAGRMGGTTAMWTNLDKIAADYQSDAEICAYIEFLKSRYGPTKGVPDFAEASAMFQAQTHDSGPVDISNMSNLDIDRLAEHYYIGSNYTRALQIYTDYYRTNRGCKEHAACRADNVRVMFRIVDCYMKLHDYANARTWQQQILAEYPGDAKACSEVYMSIAKFYEQENKTSEAMSTYDSVVTKYPSEAANCANALLSKGRLQQRLGKDDCVKTYELLIDKYPDQDFARKDGKINLALAYAARKRVDEALSIIDQLCNGNLLSPEEKVRLLYWKATTEIQQGKKAEFEKTMQDISTKFGDQKAICREGDFNLATVLAETGKRDEALLILNRIRNDKNYSHKDQASIVMLIGFIDPSKAEEAFSILISDFSDLPDCQQAYMHRANLRVKRGAYAEAMADIQMIKVPCWKYFAEGECYFAQKKYTEAAASYSKAYSNYKAGEMPKDVPERALARLVDCLTNLGNTDEAVSTLRTSLAAETSPDMKAVILFRIANVYYKSKKYRDAIKVYKEVRDLKGASVEAKAEATYRSGLCYYELKSYGSAKRCMENVAKLYQDSEWARKARGALYVWDNYGPSAQVSP